MKLIRASKALAATFFCASLLWAQSGPYQTPSGNVLGLITSYNGQALGGQGLSPEVAAVNLATQGFAVFNSATPVTLVAAAAGNAGTYRVTVIEIVTTTFVTNTTTNITIGYTDDAAAQTIVVSPAALTAGSEATTNSVFRSTGAAAITYTPKVTGTAATAGAASFSVVVERLI